MQILIRPYSRSQTLAFSTNVLLLTISILFVTVAASAQQIKPFVMNGFSASLLNKNQTYSSSIGEMATSTISANGFSITQGFLQPISLKVPCGEVVLKTFPNPVIKEMSIFAEGCDIEVASIKAYDLFGKLVLEGEIVNNEINFSSIGVGVYLVRAYNSQEQVVGVVKILKSTI